MKEPSAGDPGGAVPGQSWAYRTRLADELVWVQLVWSELTSQAPSAYCPCLMPG
jgi:hypothetical protein